MSEYHHFSLAKYLEAIYSGLNELWSHKLRSILTLFGMILGTIALIVMTSLLSGARDMIQNLFKSIGFDGVLVLQDDFTNMQRAKFGYSYSEGLVMDDAIALEQRCQHLKLLSPVIERSKVVKIQDDNLNMKLRGTNQYFLQIRGRKLKSGRFINHFDLQYGSQVCVISEELENKYFYGNALGKEISFQELRCRVVGVVENLKNTMRGGLWFNEANTIFLPITVLQTYLGIEKKIDYILVYTDFENVNNTAAEVERWMEILHHGEQDFALQNVAEEMMEAEEKATKALKTWNLILGAISSVSLLVGGIGILSIMLISISERIFEIGLRKSLGATDSEIFFQFIIESITLSTIGVLVGVTLGVASVQYVAKAFPFGAHLSKTGVLLAFGFAFGIGLIFGWYPAHKAASLQPVQALQKSTY